MGSGILLLEANCDATLSSFRDAETGELEMYNLPGSGSALIAPWDPSVEGIQRDPLFTIQHTRFQCGSVAIGMRIAHTLCAAEGTLGIYQDLAEIYRNMGQDGRASTNVLLRQPPHIIPFMSNEMTDMIPEARAAALARTPTGFSTEPATDPPLPGLPNPTSTAPDEPEAADSCPPTRIVGRTFHFPPAELAAIKAAATPPDTTSWVSTFEALSAHLWQSTHKARLHVHHHHHSNPPSTSTSTPLPPPTNHLTLYTSKNLSPPSRLALPPHYFPNAILPGATTPLPSSILASNPLWCVAQPVHAWVRGPSTTNSEALHLANWIAAQPDKGAIRHDVFPWGPGGWGFVTAAWQAYGLYSGAGLGGGGDDVDGDKEGGLVLAGVPFTEMSLFDGFAIFLEPKSKSGGGGRGGRGIDVRLTVAEGVMEVIEGDVGGLRRFRGGE
jgi:hypothetical protein